MEVFFSNLSSDPSLKKQPYHPLELFFAKNYVGSGGRGQDMTNPENTRTLHSFLLYLFYSFQENGLYDTGSKRLFCLMFLRNTKAKATKPY